MSSATRWARLYALVVSPGNAWESIQSALELAFSRVTSGDERATLSAADIPRCLRDMGSVATGSEDERAHEAASCVEILLARTGNLLTSRGHSCAAVKLFAQSPAVPPLIVLDPSALPDWLRPAVAYAAAQLVRDARSCRLIVDDILPSGGRTYSMIEDICELGRPRWRADGVALAVSSQDVELMMSSSAARSLLLNCDLRLFRQLPANARLLQVEGFVDPAEAAYLRQCGPGEGLCVSDDMHGQIEQPLS